MTPENIHTLPWMASWNFQENGGVLGLDYRRHRGRGNAVWNSKHWGDFSSEFPEGEDNESFA